MSLPHSRYLQAGLILIACWITYASAFGNGFTYDDHYVVASNDLIRSVSPVEIFTQPFWKGFVSEGTGSYYRPLTILTYALDYAVYGLTPSGFHTTNILLHSLVTLLVWQLGRRLLKSDRTALIAALVFAVHPGLSEAVSSVSARSDLLVTGFAVLAIICTLSTRKDVRAFRWIPLCLALFSKEIGLIVPALMLSVDLLWPRSHRREPVGVGATIRAQLPLLASVFVFIGLRWYAIGNLSTVSPSPMDNPLVESGFLGAFYTLPSVIAHYARLLLFPSSLSVDYGFSQIPAQTEPFALIALIAISLIVGIRFRDILRESPALVLGLVLLLLPIMAVANPIMISGSILSERYLYLPAVGFVVLLGFLIHRIRPLVIPASLRYRAGWTIVTLVLLVLSARTAARTTDWASDEKLFRSAVVETPQSVRAHLNYAEILTSKGAHALAAQHYEYVLSLKDDYPIVNLKLAKALQLAGHAERALHYYEATTRLNPGFAEAWGGLATLSIRLGRDINAERALKAAIALTPDNAALYNQLGVVYQRKGQTTKAMQAYEMALAGAFHHPGVYCNMGIIYSEAGEVGQAREALAKALKLSPDMALAHYHMGNLERDAGNTATAINHFERFLTVWRKNPAVADQVRETLKDLRSHS